MLHVLLYLTLFNFKCRASKGSFVNENQPEIKTTEKILKNAELNLCDDLKKCIDEKKLKEKNSLRLNEIRGDLLENYSAYSNSNKNNKKSNQNSITGSWSGVGMPFNVLYTPYTNRQKMFKLARQSLAGDKTSNEPIKKISQIFRWMLNNEKPSLKSDEKNSKKPMARKYYSYIPQLFVSYGW